MSGPETKGDGLDSHHMPDRHANPASTPADGPAIQMDPKDHHETSSNGRHGKAAALYRQQTANMIAQGDYRKAMGREIRDVRNAAQRGSGDRTKYNGAMKQMTKYADKSGQLPKRKTKSRR
jgi:filamentous hemagglutinin